MSERHVTIATFESPTEADLVRERLEAAGIAVLVVGDLSARAFAGFGSVGDVSLQVAGTDVERAQELLAADREEIAAQAAERGVPLTRGGRPAWVCPKCSTRVDLDMELCPTCGAVMVGPPASPDEDEADRQSQEARTWVGDKLASRAFRAALLGIFICPPLLQLYSFWLLLKLSQQGVDASPAGQRQAHAALIIDLLVLIPCVLLVLLFLTGFVPAALRGH